MNKLTLTISRDLNGNKVAKVKAGKNRTFSIQTNGNLPYCHLLSFGDVLKRGEPHTEHGLSEMVAYVFEHGTATQRSIMGLQNTTKQPLTAIL